MTETSNPQKTIVSASYQKIVEYIKALQVSEVTKEAVKSALPATAPQCLTPEYLHQEWVNEVLSTRDVADKEKAFEAPDAAFMKFALSVAKTPYEPMPRVVNKLIDNFGIENVMRIHRTIWPLDVHWIQRMRNHPNDKVSMASDMLLQLLNRRKTPTEMFERIVDFSVRHQIALDQKTFNHPNYEIPQSQIHMAPLTEEDWLPVSLQYMLHRNNKAEKWRSMSPLALSVGAQKIREQYIEESRSLQLAEVLYELDRNPLTRRFSFIATAAHAGFSSNAYVSAYEKMVEDIRTLRIVLGEHGEGIEGAFLAALRLGEKTISMPAAAEVDKIKMEISLLGREWFESIPDSFTATKRDFSEWRDAILTDTRDAPRDFTVDFCFFILDRSTKRT